MRNELTYDNLLFEMQNLIPDHAKLTKFLCDILILEKEAVYRRLNKQVPFSFREVSIIASHLQLSLDKIIGVNYQNRISFYLNTFEFINPLEKDIEFLEGFMNIIKVESGQGISQISLATNILPQNLYLNYPSISNFYLFKWYYNKAQPGNIKKFKDIIVDKRIHKLNQDFIKISHKVKATTYILDPLIFHYLVNDIKFFGSIGWIAEDDIKSLRTELLNLCQYLEEIADHGSYTDTNNAVSIYISNINLEASYCYIQAEKQEFSFVKAFTFNSIVSLEKNSINKIKRWIQSLKRVSTMISVSGEIQRREFFKKQIELINTL